jgi:hypothetical protein
MEKIHLAILNTTSWYGLDAEHLYGYLVLSTKKEVTIENVEDWNVKYLGENIEVFRDITLDEAKKLDIKDQSCGSCQRRWERGDKKSNRFNTFDEIVKAGIVKYKELNLKCDFISLYEGSKYYKNEYNDYETVVISNSE